MRWWPLLLALAACRPGTATPAPRDAAPADVDGSAGAALAGLDGSAGAALAGLDGPALYGKLCAVCHGADATGYQADNAPSLVNRTFLESATDEQLRRSIAEGRPGTSMAAYGVARGGPLAPEAVGALVAWLRGHGPPPIALPARGRGDAARGEALYAAHCRRCHGTKQARGDAVHLANPRFLDAASDPFLGWAIAKGRPGTSMAAWEGTLSDAQIDDVVAYVRAFDESAAAALLPPPTGKEPIVLHPEGRAPSFEPRSSPCPPSRADAGKPACAPDERFVSVDQVRQALAQKRRLVIIDARPPSDWMRVHIPGAVSIPYHDLARLDEVPNDGTWVIAYCACPHHLSGDVVDALRKRGVRRAAILDEGILEWHRRGYPVVTAPGVEAPPQESRGLFMPGVPR